MKKTKNFNFRKLLYSQWFILLLIVIAISAITTAVNPKFLTTRNLIAILNQISALALVAAGATVMIASGHFDISVGAVIGLSACSMAMLIIAGVNEFVVFIVGVLISVTCCTLNGALSILLNAPSFIITMATFPLRTASSIS